MVASFIFFLLLKILSSILKYIENLYDKNYFESKHNNWEILTLDYHSIPKSIGHVVSLCLKNIVLMEPSEYLSTSAP
jgi:hypothetical protein